MANQQILYAETIAAMKKAFKRKAYESDSDSETEHYGNRGHKLQKRTRFAQKGQLLPTEGPSAYKESIDYAGVRRSIIQRNPPLLDEDGYEIDSDDDDGRVGDALVAAAELNPYANVHIQNILAPLISTTELPTHPTLSKPFTSETLSHLVSQSSEMMRKENIALWQVRHLWTALCGDHTWIPCERMIGSNNVELYTEDWVARQLLSLRSSTSEEQASLPQAIEADERGDQRRAPTSVPGLPSAPTEEKADALMIDAAPTDHAVQTENGTLLTDVQVKDFTEARSRHDDGDDAKRRPVPNGKAAPGLEMEDGATVIQDMAIQNGEVIHEPELVLERTKHQASALTAQTISQDFVHPIFETPAGARPDRDIGLPEQEAEDVRRLMALYIQKQEEVCRGISKLNSGLTRADRLRTSVLQWSKAESHCGPNRDLSDGEDWYDREEWGLKDDLKKGQDDEEEDTATAGKKTRARR